MVQAKSGDSLCDEKDFRPDIIKIDVEGYELACLRGLKRTLSLQRPTLCLEIHPLFIEELGETVSGLTAMLAELGYLLFGLDGQKIDNVEVESLRNVTRLVAKPA
jgi:hypothetical protein